VFEGHETKYDIEGGVSHWIAKAVRMMDSQKNVIVGVKVPDIQFFIFND
jgi:hypothetical protein